MPTAESSWPLTIEQAAARTGGWAWAEGRLYEVVGEWAKAARSAPCKLYFDSASQHHAWRSQLWRDRLPSRLVQAYGAGLPLGTVGLHGPPSDAFETALGALAGPGSEPGRLSAYCRVVLPRVIARYRAWSLVAGPVADRPTGRALSMALADIVSDWQEGSALLVEVLDQAGEGELAEAAEATARLDRAFVGWGTW